MEYRDDSNDISNVSSNYLDWYRRHIKETLPDKNISKYILLTPIPRDIVGFVSDTVFWLSGWRDHLYIRTDNDPVRIMSAGPVPDESCPTPHRPDKPVIYFLHGLNPLNGLENIHFLGRLAEYVDVKIILHDPTLCNSHRTNETMVDHIHGVAEFIRDDIARNQYTDYHLVGDSYGSIRLAVLYRHFPELLNSANTIVIVDPLTINLAFSPTIDRIWNCVFQTCDILDAVIGVLNDRDQYDFLLNNLDVYQWAIDSEMLRRYKDTMHVIIGRNDRYIAIDESSPIIHTTGTYHFTDDVHGGVLTRDLNEFISLVEYPSKTREGFFGFRKKCGELFQSAVYHAIRFILP
jgi:pimeloyl-ACP methyl ester carboxylesterase